MKRKVRVKKLEGSPFAIEYEVAGRGASATIVKAYNLEDREEDLVCKIVPMAEEQASGVYKAELQILKQIPEHTTLVHYKRMQISSEKNLYLIMEFCMRL